MRACAWRTRFASSLPRSGFDDGLRERLFLATLDQDLSDPIVKTGGTRAQP